MMDSVMGARPAPFSLRSPADEHLSTWKNHQQVPHEGGATNLTEANLMRMMGVHKMALLMWANDTISGIHVAQRHSLWEPPTLMLGETPDLGSCRDTITGIQQMDRVYQTK